MRRGRLIHELRKGAAKQGMRVWWILISVHEKDTVSWGKPAYITVSKPGSNNPQGPPFTIKLHVPQTTL